MNAGSYTGTSRWIIFYYAAMEKSDYVISGGGFFKEYAAEMWPIHTMWYSAPDRAVHWNGPLDIEDDYFALGVSVWELFTGRRPFEEMDDNTVWKWIREGNVVDLEEITDEEALRRRKR